MQEKALFPPFLRFLLRFVRDTTGIRFVSAVKYEKTYLICLDIKIVLGIIVCIQEDTMWIFAQVHVCHAKTSFSTRQYQRLTEEQLLLDSDFLQWRVASSSEAAWRCGFRHIGRLQDTVGLFPAIFLLGGKV